MEEEVKIKRPCPYDEASFLSKLFFGWMIPLFRAGYSKDLDLEDLHKCSEADEPQRVGGLLEKKWNEELLLAKEYNRKPSIIRAIIKAFGWRYLLVNQLLFFNECGVRIGQPLLVGLVVRYFSQPNFEGSVSYQTAYLASIGICVSSVVYMMLRHQYFIQVLRVGMNVRTAINILVYKKILKLSRSSLETTNMGQILNILANDLNRFDEIAWTLYYIVVAPVQVVIAMYILWHYLNVACFGGVIILFLFIPFQALMGKFFNKFRRQTAQLTDKRVKLMGEIISAMKLIKVYCWEKPFAELVDEVRREEVRKIRWSSFLKGTNLALSFIATRVMLFASFIAFLYMGGHLTAEVVFVTMSLYNTMRIPVTYHLANAIGLGAETLVSCKRVQNLLMLEEIDRSIEYTKVQSTIVAKGSVILEHFSAKWTTNVAEPTLKGIIMRAKPGELVVVIGPVGSGKTCLLMGLLGEISKLSGKCLINGQTSYAPQESWCFTTTIRQNILFGAEYNVSRYQRVLRVCGLEKDIQLFPYGDTTFVGEKGYTLSGGQKARITLARAVYNVADIYLLDDPLSAVDPVVANHIFDKCIRGFLKGKTVILVTHQLQFIKQADKILILKDGQNLAFGTFNALMNSGVNYMSFLETETENKKNVTHQQSLAIDDIYEQQTEGVKKRLCAQMSLSENQETREEAKTLGSVKGAVYWEYIRAGAGPPFLILVVIASLGSQIIFHYTDLWLSDWTKDYDTYDYSNHGNHDNSSNSTSYGNETLVSPVSVEAENANIVMYCSLVVSLFLTAFIRTTTMFVVCLSSSIRLHNRIFRRLLRAPVVFFENNPMGRILNRFTRDMGLIDQQIPPTLVDLNISLMNTLGVVIVSCIVSPYLIIPAVILALCSLPFRKIYLRTGRDIKRFDATTRSPVYSHIGTTFDGLTVVRAFGLQQKFEEQYFRFLEDSVACRFLLIGTARGIGFALDWFSTIYIFSICLVLMVFPQGIPSGDVGLILSSALILIGMFQYGIRLTAEFETQMVSVERVLEYGILPSEAALVSPKPLPPNWPEHGNILFKHVYLTYANNPVPVLNDINFEIKGGQKIGIVGRTGAGKSSLLSVLFRLVEPDGLVTIDGLETKTIGLHDLRSKISIIPQDPTLFSGSVRRNLDPFDEYNDDTLWQILMDVDLHKVIKLLPLQLDGLITEGGGNLSVGQRQLLCLARAMLKRNKILVLDEATANVDHETDQMIQKTIKEKFETCTVLTIAHRLNTVIDMDKILMLDEGKVVEFEEPYVLLKQHRGYFSRLVQRTGPHFARLLYKIAEESYLKKHPEANKSLVESQKL